MLSYGGSGGGRGLAARGRKLLQLALQNCARLSSAANAKANATISTIGTDPEGSSCSISRSRNYALMGELYSQLVELSPSRKDALERVADFTQLVNTLTTSAASSSAVRHVSNAHCDDGVCGATGSGSSSELIDIGINPDVVDRVASLAFNYGITLVELDQVVLAERFLSRAVSLLHSGAASKAFKDRQTEMEVRKRRVFKTKNDNSQIDEHPILYHPTAISISLSND